ncbi:hypothetical protein [Longimicrobium sp.]|uniref:hypothetical protein n=1 Tax=Longimicrobium sp. TaxID=2029185 RepID=UPI002B7411A3|nr:hypothetical protein [Longimicrobium sp.]HSU16289.1 hypothetical protein [Longimicrobium sp.]
MSDQHPVPGGSNLPARKLSSTELEAVIKRAVELQTARETEMTDGLSDAEVVRIGKELGIEQHLVRRAISEVRSRPPEEHGLTAAMMGPGIVRAARTIRRPAVELGIFLEKYLLEAEFMVVERRFPDRTRYVRAQGIGAAVGRTLGKVGSRVAPLDLQTVDVGVALADEDSSVVTLQVDLSTGRTWGAVGGLLGGTAGGGGLALAVLATTAPHILALAGVGVLAAGVFGSRGIYRIVARTIHNKLEAFLDRLEHGELRLPQQKQEWQKRFGL